MGPAHNLCNVEANDESVMTLRFHLAVNKTLQVRGVARYSLGVHLGRV
jgi:hypothetical protein